MGRDSLRATGLVAHLGELLVAGRLALVLGGDCSILLGTVLALRWRMVGIQFTICDPDLDPSGRDARAPAAAVVDLLGEPWGGRARARRRS